MLKQLTAALIIFSVSVILSCDNEALLTNLSTNRLIVVLKGTYESNSPMPWSMPTACAHVDPVSNKCDTYTPEYLAQLQDDSVYVCNATYDVLPTTFMIDLAEIRLWDSHGKAHKFANYRQTYASGLNDIDPLFNGAGYPMINDDVPSKTYPFVLLYIRKMLLDSAQRYTSQSTGWVSTSVWDVFKEAEYPTYNFNGLQLHSYFDTLRLESTSINRVYPLVIPINNILTGGTGMTYKGDFSATVLEIRLVVKNYIKKYEQRASSTDVTHFHALSDWLNDVEKNDTVIGGNVIAVARTYIPEFVGRISGSASSGRHVIAIPHGQNPNLYTLNVNPWGTAPPAATLRSNNPCDLPKSPGYYTGTDISAALDYFLQSEKYKYDWNQKVPTASCGSYEVYCAQWDKYAGRAASFTIPDLVVYVPAGGQFTIENVMPGTYDVYIASRAPGYGKLYNDGEFVSPQTVTVTPGSNPFVVLP